MISFDTNILLYASDSRAPEKQAIAIRLLDSGGDAVLTWQSACEFISASKKLERFGLSRAEAWDQLFFYLDAFKLVTPNESTLQKARDLHLNRQWSFWDALIVAACLDAGVTRLYSEDLPGSAAPAGLDIVNPFA